MAPYSMDLRKRVARAWDAGMDAESVAKFHGRASAETEEQRVAALITGQPDAAPAELRGRPADARTWTMRSRHCASAASTMAQSTNAASTSAGASQPAGGATPMRRPLIF